MKLILAPLLILLLIGSTYFYFYYGNTQTADTQISESKGGEETTQPQELPISELNTTTQETSQASQKEIPEWLIKYQNLPKEKQFSTMKKILEERTAEQEISDIADNLEIFPEVYNSNDKYKTAITLIDMGCGEIVFKNMDKFEINDVPRQEEVIRKIREKGQIYLLAQNFNFFKFSQSREYFFAEELFEKYPYDLINNFEKFKQIQKADHYKFANKAIDKDKENVKYNYYEDNTCQLMRNMYKFTGLTEKQKIDLFNRAYDNKFGCGLQVLENFEKWDIKNLEARLDIAAKIIMMGYGGSIPESIGKFKFNSEQQLLIAQRIIDTKNDGTIEDLERDVYFFNTDVAEEILRRLNK